ncbi:glycerophosphodiester phosphodiesterase [Roseisolibacter agri]|uniref:Glycerophosphoryl diester phosphodiesterase n=1 Tax=Roseisolibacter agri TaxID=2014610 RepID=A0AA37QI68_9BACT|nr:glycerophosphodiester phosphodiesterase [Roseisolibacter agri]GLC27303.1 glycerophosphoryl diester phosphodiesterase [Roseisolibacter agri]
MPRPEIIAHRGTPRVHPENSLPGFARALELGVDGIELDVHLTRDGVPVVHHDPDLGPGAESPVAGRRIVDLTLDELRTHALAPGVPVPTLAEVCALADGRAVLYVEVKARDAEDAVAALLAARGDRTPVHSFDHRVSRGVRDRAPATPVGVLSVSYLVDTIGAMRAADARDLWQHWSMIDAPLVESVHAAGGRVIAWTVNDPAHAVALARMGVDGVCTDLPDQMAAALAPRIS